VRARLAGLLAALAASIPGQGCDSSRQPPAPAPAPAAAAQDLARLFGESLPGARLQGSVALYDEKTLSDYIDGAAPLYLSRHFLRLAAADLAVAGGGEITADVYDMAAPENAASIFAAEVSSRAKPLAGFEAAAAGSMSLVFRQGRFYVKLTAFDARGEAALPEVGRALAARMR
jgi:hypothetical protein